MMASSQRPRSAADWAARLRSDRVTAEDRDAYEQWLDADPGNRNSASQLDQVWQSLEGLEDDPMVQAVLSAPPRRKRGWTWMATSRPFAGAVLCLALVAISFTLWRSQNEGAVYETANGEQRIVDLADGSRLHLNVSTRLEVSLHGAVRNVQLVQGQAFFDVASDPSRPFVVTAGDKKITVLGTKFDVLLRGEDTRVTVIEGRVAVASLSPILSEAAPGGIREAPDAAASVAPPADSPAADYLPPLELTDRDAVSWPRRSRPSAVLPSVAVPAVEAWISGKVVFDSTPLGEAVVELDRYTPVKMRLGSEELGSTTVSGVFYIDRLADVESLVFALENSLPILAEQRGGELLLLSAN
ncbi:MAG: FecR domain-containing protein [Acidobacteriota bacterium]